MGDKARTPGGVAVHPASHTDGAARHGLRNYNERLVLSAVRSGGPIASAEIARRTGLSAQTASVITRALEAEGLLSRGDPVRGKVGKPYTPLTIAPDGATSLGLRVGRRVADIALLDLAGGLLGQMTTTYPYPTPATLLAFVAKALDRFVSPLPPAQAAKIVGLGIGAPFELWNWLDLVGAPKAEMMAWKDFSFETALAEMTPLPVTVGNDATLACFGEMMFGKRADPTDFAHLYIGTFAGGGLVLNGRLVTGPNGNAGGIGPVRVRGPADPENQLLHHASLFVLEAMLTKTGAPTEILRQPDADWSGLGPGLDDWIARAAEALTTACLSLVAILDMPTVVIDGRFPPAVRARLVEQVREGLGASDVSGIIVPEIRPGSLGARAGVLGAGYRPIQERYFEV